MLRTVLRLDNWRGFGTWRPGRHNLALAVIQGLSIVQAGIRGFDYVKDRPSGVPLSPILAAVEEVGPLPAWGGLLLLGAAAIIQGLNGGWITPIFLGHAVLTAGYLLLGILMLTRVPVVDVVAAALGGLALGGGMALVFDRWKRRNAVRFWLATVLVFGGGWVAVQGLGYDFRSATALIAAAGIQAALLLGTAVLVRRELKLARGTAVPSSPAS